MVRRVNAHLSRRALICAACAVPVLSACGAGADKADLDGTPSPEADRSPTASTTPSPSESENDAEKAASPDPAPSADSSETPAPSTTTTKPSGALIKTSDVPVGGGVVLSSAGIVVTQPSSGTFRGFTNICTHQGCGVTKVSGGNIICPCHGSEFSIVNGSVTSGPARTALGAKGVTVKSGWVCKA